MSANDRITVDTPRYKQLDTSSIMSSKLSKPLDRYAAATTGTAGTSTLTSIRPPSTTASSSSSSAAAITKAPASASSAATSSSSRTSLTSIIAASPATVSVKKVTSTSTTVEPSISQNTLSSTQAAIGVGVGGNLGPSISIAAPPSTSTIQTSSTYGDGNFEASAAYIQQSLSAANDLLTDPSAPSLSDLNTQQRVSAHTHSTFQTPSTTTTHTTTTAHPPHHTRPLPSQVSLRGSVNSDDDEDNVDDGFDSSNSAFINSLVDRQTDRAIDKIGTDPFHQDTVAIGSSDSRNEPNMNSRTVVNKEDSALLYSINDSGQVSLNHASTVASNGIVAAAYESKFKLMQMELDRVAREAKLMKTMYEKQLKEMSDGMQEQFRESMKITKSQYDNNILQIVKHQESDSQDGIKIKTERKPLIKNELANKAALNSGGGGSHSVKSENKYSSSAAAAVRKTDSKSPIKKRDSNPDDSSDDSDKEPSDDENDRPSHSREKGNPLTELMPWLKKRELLFPISKFPSKYKQRYNLHSIVGRKLEHWRFGLLCKFDYRLFPTSL